MHTNHVCICTELYSYLEFVNVSAQNNLDTSKQYTNSRELSAYEPQICLGQLTPLPAL